MSYLSEDEEFAADEAARIKTIQDTAPKEIWLQTDEDGEQYDGWDGQTWCSESINRSDVKYVRADRITELEAENTQIKINCDYAWQNNRILEKARVAAEAKLAEAEARLQAIYATEPVAWQYVNEDGDFAYANNFIFLKNLKANRIDYAQLIIKPMNPV